MTQRPRRGFTLIETLFAIGGFVLAGLLTFALFKYGLNAHQRGLLGTDTQRSAREFASRLSAELQAAVAVQDPRLIQSNASMQSPVMAPNTQTDSAVNDIAFFIPAYQDVSKANADLTQSSSYLLVRYTRPAGARNAVFRRTYASTDWSTWNNSAVTFNTCWKVTGFPDAPPASAAVTDPNWKPVVSLAGPDDLVAFSLSHVQVANNDPKFDPYHFAIRISVARYMGSLAVSHNTLNDATWLSAGFPPPSVTDTDAQNDRVRKDLTAEITMQHYQ